MIARQRLVAAGIVATCVSGFTAWLLACGPFLTDLETVTTVTPADEVAFVRGDVGVVRPHLARRYFVHAYRTFSGLPAATAPPPAARQPALTEREPSPLEQWAKVRDEILGTAVGGAELNQYRRLANTYQDFLNCGDSAFLTAVRTAEARRERFGAASAEIRDWARAQVAVFRNCAEEALVLPQPAPADANPLVRADRAYQTAAANFYAMRYEEATRQFRAIANDRSSPWRSFGRYLAARASIRFATVPADSETRGPERLAVAERDLQAVLADPSARDMHGAAKDLLGFVEARLHPIARLHELSGRLATASLPADRDLEDYRWLMDRLIGDTVAYNYSDLKDREAMITGDDLTDWVLAMQDGRDAAAPRALGRWQATGSTPWLVATMWTLPANHSSVNDVLEAAQNIDRTAPAYPTVAFLRVRLLAAAGRPDDARAVLNDLPGTRAPGFAAEAVNLLAAERLMLARSFDEFLSAVPRSIVALSGGGQVTSTPAELQPFNRSVFGEDSAVTLNDRLPLDRLVAAAESRILPDHLRVQVAAMAFSRAVLLQREPAILAAARILRDRAPAIRADADRVLNASNATDRHHAEVLLLLRTPGMHASLNLRDDDVSYEASAPPRTFDHMFRRNWWCGFDDRITDGQLASTTADWITTLYPTGRLPFPSFIGDAERATVDRELRTLAATGAARNYLAAEAIQWAQSRPTDLDAAEALALVVEGWRWSNCGDKASIPLSQRAFQTLHRLFPTSEWAKRTRFWYR